MIYVARFGDIVSVGGVGVVQDKEDQWKSMNGELLSSLQLRALFTFLHEENRAIRKRFHNYVDRMLNELIYD